MVHIQPHTQIAFEDLSGGSSGNYSNPYDALIEGSNDDIKTIQARYASHRTTRNAQQKTKLLDPAFSGVLVDEILRRVHDPTVEPGYDDPRHCLTLWARPPERVRQLVDTVQQKLLAIAPNLWVMPPPNLHLTAIEVNHSQTAETIAALVEAIKPSLPTLVNYTQSHRARLIKPMISYDAQALALSFLPAAGEALPPGRTADEDSYSYHHLRRDLYTTAEKAGVQVASRYVVPSAHLTIARFIDRGDFSDADGKPDPEKMKQLVETVEELNHWLESEFWPKEGDERREGVQWIVGEERGLDCRAGTVWYGGGRSEMVGAGF
ncbi:hypothetical protein NA57DRAFT_73470 [Rhizodiscina lignyota]|uniref:RNA ligase/cyclic nucleotide phosphodiesterase n=1 Tax=Rhizodiscina lignyota TaxID=1504668 RepID=A0A9P4II92_9PEZI|nr:hypothetical protein NA57DRAFT_73470 [Rhizodiscina lignyota]